MCLDKIFNNNKIKLKMKNVNFLNQFTEDHFDHQKVRESYVWRSTDGKSRLVKELSDSHLKNIIKSPLIHPNLRKFLELELIYRDNNDENVNDYNISNPNNWLNFFHK